MNQPQSGARVVEVDGFQLAIDGHDSLGLGQHGRFEPDVLAALQRWARAGQTVVDIGANIGYFTAHLARAVGAGGVVHAFEPEPANAALLRANMRRNGLNQVQLHELALGESPGRALLHTAVDNGGMHRLYGSVCCDGPAVEVPVQRLDTLLVPGSVALIKIDVEGFEHAVLRGAQLLMSTSPRPRLISEYCPASMLEAGASPSAFLNDLLAWGLRPFDLDGRAIDPSDLFRDAARYEGYGRERFVAACQGLDNTEIAAVVVELSRTLGCQRPMIENLLFAERI
jgi:FkbM family methyltransferase